MMNKISPFGRNDMENDYATASKGDKDKTIQRPDAGNLVMEKEVRYG
jgi:hypothetical protein